MRAVADLECDTCLFVPQVVAIVLYWVGEQFSEFEEMAEMMEFLDWFEGRLVEDVSKRPCQSTSSHCTSCSTS